MPIKSLKTNVFRLLKRCKMANNKLEVEVTCGLNIDPQSAEFALKAVNIYCDRNG